MQFYRINFGTNGSSQWLTKKLTKEDRQIIRDRIAEQTAIAAKDFREQRKSLKKEHNFEFAPWEAEIALSAMVPGFDKFATDLIFERKIAEIKEKKKNSVTAG